MISEAPGAHAASPASDAWMIEIDDLHKSYGLMEAVKGVSLHVGRGEAQFVIGPSGCGKSTLLRCINLLEEPTAGRLRVGNTSLTFGPGSKHLTAREQAAFRAKVGMVFQQFHLFRT